MQYAVYDAIDNIVNVIDDIDVDDVDVDNVGHSHLATSTLKSELNIQTRFSTRWFCL